MSAMTLAAKWKQLESEIMAEDDRLHRTALLEGIEAVCRRELGGCECERRLHDATRRPNDEAEAAKMLLPRVLADLQCVARFKGNRGPGFAEGLAIIASTATRLAGTFDETDSD